MSGKRQQWGFENPKWPRSLDVDYHAGPFSDSMLSSIGVVIRGTEDLQWVLRGCSCEYKLSYTRDSISQACFYSDTGKTSWIPPSPVSTAQH